MDRKQVLLSKDAAFDETEHSVTATLSQEQVDADHEVLLLAGCDLSRFLKNPIGLLDHDSRQRVGTWLWLRKQADRLVGKLQLKGSDLAERVWRQIVSGVLRAVSVGFVVQESGPPTASERTRWPGCERVIRAWQLLEASLVSVPSNESALIEAVHGKSLASHDLKALISEKVAEAACTEFYCTEFPAMIADAIEAQLFEITGVIDERPVAEMKSDLAALFVSGPPEITPEICSTISEILTRHVEGAIQSAIETCR